MDRLFPGSCRKESEALARFDGGARENDAIDLLREKRGDGHGDGEIGLARAAGADGENHVVGFEGFDVSLLVGTLGRDALFAEGTHARRGERTMQRGRRLVGRDAEQRLYFLAAGDVPIADALVVGVEDAGGALDLSGFAFDFDVVVFQVRADAQRGFEEFQILIEGAEELVDASGDSYGLFHPVG